jgi:hypothetical protein
MGNIAFISNNFYDLDDLYEDGQFYFINIDVLAYEEPHNFSITLNKRFDNAKTILESNFKVRAAGWHHFDVTRNSTGCFTVYHNGSQIMQVVDTDIDTSEMFWLWWSNWQTLENVVVDDDWDYTTTTTTTTSTDTPSPDPDWGPILIIGGVAVVAIALIVVVAKRR